MTLRTHDITLVGEHVTLRPLTENHWDVLLSWNNDRALLYYMEGEDVLGYRLDQVQEIYRTVSQTAFCFIAHVGTVAVGECWLQEMNLDRILRLYPHKDCRRIDLMIGERSYRGRGLGTEMICLLTSFAFEREHADMVFGCDISDYNIASIKAFRNAGYTVAARIEQPLGHKARYCVDLITEGARV